ncbi:MAG TPA: 6-phosphogluconolactonase, partial [Gemmatimonadaceae bacterium]|nr:6-phosphogluconolactonase [Gemmatimonadaceae bacterium]
MPGAQIRLFPTPDAIGEHVAAVVLERIERARREERRFLLGCPTGRTPKPIFAAMGRLLARTRADISHLALVMMDEYLVPQGEALGYAPSSAPWSCHHFARAEIADRLNAGLPEAHRLRTASIWFPDPRDPAAYDARIATVGGIDYFLLASGATDGHVAFNPPGSPRESRTRIIALSEETRRDNLQTFPSFGTLDAVPHHGISVGIDTIIRSKEAAMVVWGEGKRLTL